MSLRCCRERSQGSGRRPCASPSGSTSTKCGRCLNCGRRVARNTYFFPWGSVPSEPGGYVCVLPGMTSGTSSAGRARMVRRRSDRASTKSSTASRNPTGNASVLVSAYPRLSRISSRGRRMRTIGASWSSSGAPCSASSRARSYQGTPRGTCCYIPQRARTPQIPNICLH